MAAWSRIPSPPVAMAVSVGAWGVVSCLPLAMYKIMEAVVLRSRRRVEEVAEICEEASEPRERRLKDEEFRVARNPLSAAL